MCVSERNRATSSPLRRPALPRQGPSPPNTPARSTGSTKGCYAKQCWQRAGAASHCLLPHSHAACDTSTPRARARARASPSPKRGRYYSHRYADFRVGQLH